jgi:hypothetical protein
MKQGYGTVDTLLGNVIARCGKVHRAQLLTSLMLMILSDRVRGHQNQ